MRLRWPRFEADPVSDSTPISVASSGSGTEFAAAPLTLPAELSNLAALQAYLADCATAFGLAPKRVGALAVAFEEVFVNICHYAYPQGPGPVTLSCRAAAEGYQLIVEVLDQGQAFDAASIGEPDLAADLDTRKIGGLGWFLVRQIADQLECFREDGRNIVRLTMYRSS